jgi:hypothetical protein
MEREKTDLNAKNTEKNTHCKKLKETKSFPKKILKKYIKIACNGRKLNHFPSPGQPAQGRV